MCKMSLGPSSGRIFNGEWCHQGCSPQLPQNDPCQERRLEATCELVGVRYIYIYIYNIIQNNHIHMHIIHIHNMRAYTHTPLPTYLPACLPTSIHPSIHPSTHTHTYNIYIYLYIYIYIYITNYDVPLLSHLLADSKPSKPQPCARTCPLSLWHQHLFRRCLHRSSVARQMWGCPPESPGEIR